MDNYNVTTYNPTVTTTGGTTSGWLEAMTADVLSGAITANGGDYYYVDAQAPVAYSGTVLSEEEMRRALDMLGRMPVMANLDYVTIQRNYIPVTTETVQAKTSYQEEEELHELCIEELFDTQPDEEVV